MAIFIPSIPESFNGSYGEEEVFNSLKTLDNQYTVFHSLSWIGINERTLGEADFVIVHPQKGIIVIEVKSGEIKFSNGEWKQTNTQTRVTKIINPFLQARRSQYEIHERLQMKLKTAKIPLICHCVWFPSVEIKNNDELPLEANKDLVLDKKSLNNAKEAVDNAFKFWINKKRIYTNLSDIEYKQVINVLCPYFHAIPKLNTTINEAEQYYFRLTNKQIALLNFLQEQNTAVIHGLAGSGKTVLAIEKAKMLSEPGGTVLFLCFNSLLKDYLRKTYSIPRVVFHNAHSLAYEMLPDPNMTIDEVFEMFLDYLENVYEPEDWIYSNIVIDEGQDLDDRLLNKLFDLVKSKNGSFYVFYDRNQYIMRNQMPQWIEKAECRLILNKNCRNTAEVFKTACSVIGINDSSYSNDIHGLIPDALFYKEEKQLRTIVNKFVKDSIDGGLCPEEIVILTATAVDKSWFKNDQLICGYRMVDEFNGEGILFSTIRKFKGLEAKAILIIDILMSDLSNEEMKRLLYVGFSRAKYFLNIAILEDIETNEIGAWLKKISKERNVPKNKKGLGRLLNVNIKA